MVPQHKIPVRRVLKKDLLRLPQPKPIECQGNYLHHSAILHRGAKSSNIRHIGDPQRSTGHAAVNIGLDGVSKNDIGLMLMDQLFVKRKQFQL